MSCIQNFEHQTTKSSQTSNGSTSAQSDRNYLAFESRSGQQKIKIYAIDYDFASEKYVNIKKLKA